MTDRNVIERSLGLRHGIVGGSSMAFGYIFAAGATLSSLILGIFAIVAVSPFREQNLTLGIILVVFAVFGIMGLIGFIVGAIVGLIIALPCLCFL